MRRLPSLKSWIIESLATENAGRSRELLPSMATESARRMESTVCRESLRARVAESGGVSFFSIIMPYTGPSPRLWARLFCACASSGSVTSAIRRQNIYPSFLKSDIFRIFA